MHSNDTDQPVFKHIQHLTSEEHQLFEKGTLNEVEARRLKSLQIELDQCWDLLRQRRAKRETGHPASEAQVRPPGTVEGYIG